MYRFSKCLQPLCSRDINIQISAGSVIAEKTLLAAGQSVWFLHFVRPDRDPQDERLSRDRPWCILHKRLSAILRICVSSSRHWLKNLKVMALDIHGKVPSKSFCTDMWWRRFADPHRHQHGAAVIRHRLHLCPDMRPQGLCSISKVLSCLWAQVTDVARCPATNSNEIFTWFING